MSLGFGFSSRHAKKTTAKPSEPATPAAPHIQALIEPSKELLDEKQAAAMLDLSPGTLSVWRSTGRYKLPFLKVGRNVGYRRVDLEDWLQQRCRVSGATA